MSCQGLQRVRLSIGSGKAGCRIQNTHWQTWRVDALRRQPALFERGPDFFARPGRAVCRCKIGLSSFLLLFPKTFEVLHGWSLMQIGLFISLRDRASLK